MTQARPTDVNSPSAGVTELQLLERVREGDAPGMRLFYERYAGYLTAVGSRYIVDRDMLKDVLQESFIKIFGHIGEFEYRGEGSVRAWVTRIVVNHALKALRRSNKTLSYVGDLPDREAEEDQEDPSGWSRIPPQVLQDMIRSLPDGYRAVFNLYVFEKKSHKQIADLLGIKEDSSASQFFRARATLAKKIKAYIKEHDNE